MRNVDVKPAEARRSWLFLPGAERDALLAGPDSGADVLILEMEDFVPRERREEARSLIAEIVPAWRHAGVVSAIRINPVWDEGMADLGAAMAAAPDIVALPKVAKPRHMVDLDRAVGGYEASLGIAVGQTELLANVESAAGLRMTFEIAKSSPRIKACLVASEDMAADLGAERTRSGAELGYVRQRFLVDCVAAGVVAVDCPYPFSDIAGAEADTRWARGLGYRAKSAVVPAHAAAINEVLTPSPDEIARAKAVVSAFEAARAAGRDRAEIDGQWVEVPAYGTAKRLLERARILGVLAG